MKKKIIILILILALTGQAMAAVTTLNIADSKGAKGDMVKVPIKVTGASNLGAMDIVLRYDRNVLKGIEAEGGALASNAMVASKEIKQERLKISFADSGSISGDGTIVDVTFEVVGDAGASTQISIEAVGWDANLLDVQMKTSSGTFRVEEKSKSIVPIIIVAIIVLLILFFVVKKYQKKKE